MINDRLCPMNYFALQSWVRRNWESRQLVGHHCQNLIPMEKSCATDPDKDMLQKLDNSCTMDGNLFQKWLTANFLSNNRTKTVNAEKYDKICRYMLGDNRNTNAKFRYWVRIKGFFLAPSCQTKCGHSYQGHELMIKSQKKEVRLLFRFLDLDSYRDGQSNPMPAVKQ